jgi:hypothetical protein
MDLCHCSAPKVPEGTIHGVCASCGMCFILREWKRDSRVKEARRAAVMEFKVDVVREPITSKPDPYRLCECGSGKKFKFCCKSKT